MKRIGILLGKNGGALLSGVAGFLLGIAICLPFGLKLPDPVMSLIGSAVGAIAAVGGAFWVWQTQEDKRDSVVRARLSQHITLVTVELNTLIIAVNVPNTSRTSPPSIEAFKIMLLKTINRLGATELGALSTKSVEAFFGVEIALDNLMDEMPNLLKDCKVDFDEISARKSRSMWISYLRDMEGTLSSLQGRIAQ